MRAANISTTKFILLLAAPLLSTLTLTRAAQADSKFDMGFFCTVDPQLECDIDTNADFHTKPGNTGLSVVATAGHGTRDCASASIAIAIDGHSVGATGLLAPGHKTGVIQLGSFAPGKHVATLTQAEFEPNGCSELDDYSIALKFIIGKAKPTPTPRPTPTKTPTPTPTPLKELHLEIDPSGGAHANGAIGNKANVTVKVAFNNGTPVPGQAVNVDTPFFDNQFGLPEPRVIICDNSGRRVYPSDENNDVFAFQRFTDSLGNLTYDVYLGNDVGGPNLPDHQLGLSAKLPDFTNINQHDLHFLPLLENPANSFGAVIDSITTLVASGGSVAGAKSNIGGQIANIGPLQSLQDGLLATFNEIRVADPTILQNSDFGPIHTADGLQGAVLFYPKNNPEPLIDHFNNNTALPGGYATAVFPIEKVIDTYKPQVGEFMSLSEWENGFNSSNPPIPAHGHALAGRAVAQIGDEVRFFGFPYPPAESELAAYNAASHCLGPTVGQISATVHSPATLLFTDADGKQLGIDSNGNIVSTVIGGVYVGGKVQVYIVPVGKYTITVAGTGSGPVTIVMTSPGATENNVEVFEFHAKKNQHGTLNIAGSGNPVGKLTFGGKTFKGAKGLKLAVHGIPHHVTGEKTRNFTLSVTDQFKKPLPGAVVTASGKKLSVIAISNASGKVHLPLIAPSRGAITVRVKAPGFVSFQTRVGATFVPPKKKPGKKKK